VAVFSDGPDGAWAKKVNCSPKAKELAALKQLLLLYGDHSPFLYADFVNVKKGIVLKTVIERS